MGARRAAESKNRGGAKLLIIIFILVIIVCGILLAIKIIKDNDTAETQNMNGLNDAEVVELKKEPEPTTFSGNDRPIAVMIDNHKDAWPQANINEADIVYEIIVEGGETRLMAIYKGKDLEKLGPIRSARHYFIDYAAENDAVLVHYGESPQAASDFKDLGVDEVNGLIQSSSDFWRDKGKYAPHNAVSSTANIKKIMKAAGDRLTSDKKLLNYVAKDYDLDSELLATEVTTPISSVQTMKYVYNEETKLYTRCSKSTPQKDWVTGEEIVTKNIIITFIENYTLNDPENKGRQGLYNIGDKEGYYITNGKAVKIICSKSDRIEKTTYKTLDGEEIKVNDGNTFIQICPLDTQGKMDFGPQPEPVVDNTTIENGNTTT